MGNADVPIRLIIKDTDTMGAARSGIAIFGRPLQDLPLDDLIAEIRARLKEDADAWQALLTIVQEHIVEAVPADGVAEWTDEWIKENKWPE